MSEPRLQTRTFGSGTAVITYDVRGDLADACPDRPALVIVGSPMEAAGFVTLASHFADRPVVTYDPRGTDRNPTDTSDVTPDHHAADLHTLIQMLGAGPVDLFASSGGAVNALALVTAHPDDVRRLIAHEPPTAALLPDRDLVLAVCDDIRSTYAREGSGAAMAKFIALVMVQGPLADDYLDQPVPDPAASGLSREDDGTRTDPLMRTMGLCNAFEPEVEALRALGDRLIIGVGVQSGQQIAARGARSVAGTLGLPITDFPGDHTGFLGGEYGYHGEPDAFAATLRAVLD